MASRATFQVLCGHTWVAGLGQKVLWSTLVGGKGEEEAECGDLWDEG